MESNAKNGRSHAEKLAERLADMLVEMSQGKRLRAEDLVEKYGIDKRTAYRDFNRLACITEKLPDGSRTLAAEYRGRLQPQDLAAFARLVGVGDLFPQNNPRFLMALLDTLSQNSILVRGHHYEKLQPHSPLFQELEEVVRKRLRCTLTYAGKHRRLEPYRLINNKGIWYLAATEQGKLKTFALSRISLLVAARDAFEPDANIQQQIDADDDIWFSDEKMTVRLLVAAEAAYYFKRRKLFPAQVIETKHSDGSLTITSAVANENQILPLVQYWIPHVRVLGPKQLAEVLAQELVQYMMHLSTHFTESTGYR